MTQSRRDGEETNLSSTSFNFPLTSSNGTERKKMRVEMKTQI
jgi:hypothetical protein